MTRKTSSDGSAHAFGQIGKPVIIRVILHNVNEKPYLIINDRYFGENELDLNKTTITQAKYVNGKSYTFEILSVQKPCYFSLLITEEGIPAYILKHYHFEPGDQVEMNITKEIKTGNYNIRFTGNGCIKYRCMNELAYVLSLNATAPVTMFSENGEYNKQNEYIKDMETLSQLVERYHGELSAYSYELLKADIIAHHGRRIIGGFFTRMNAALQINDINTYMKLADEYRNAASLIPVNENIHDFVKYESMEYPQFLTDKLVCDFLERYTCLNFVCIYNSIRRTEESDLRDKMILWLFIKYMTEMHDEFPALILASAQSIKKEECLTALNQIVIKTRSKLRQKKYPYN